MVVKPFSKILNPDEIFGIQNRQYSERILLSGTVPAGETIPVKTTVSNLGHFFCMYMTGTFSTIASPAGAIVDTGLSYLSGQLFDGAGMRKLFSDLIPLDLLLSPGRRKDSTSTTVLTDPVSNSLFYPIELEYLFTANSDILLQVFNSSDEDNSLEICFHGIRIISDMVVRNKIGTGGTLRRTKNQPNRRG